MRFLSGFTQDQLEFHFLPLQRFLLPAMLWLLVIVSVLSGARAWVRTSSDPLSAYDFHPYWYYGHFVRIGVNPYVAYAEKLAPPKDIQYVDGGVSELDSKQHTSLGRVPANSASVMLWGTLFTWFSWDTAKYILLLINLAMCIAIPWLVMRLLPPSLQLPSQLKWLAALSFYAMKGFRESAADGQGAILVFFLMIVTLLIRESNWLLAGLALGFALGKYSLALPVCIFLLLEKRFRILIVATVVQVVSLLIVASLDNGGRYPSIWQSVIATLNVYWRMAGRHYLLSGIHLRYTLLNYPQLGFVVLILVTVATLGMVVYSCQRRWTAADLLPVNSALVLWILLAVYHRNYDTFVTVLFFILLLSVIATWPISPTQKLIFGIFYVFIVGIFCLPGDMLNNYLSEGQTESFKIFLDESFTVVLTLMLGVNLWLLPRTPRGKLQVAIPSST